jgi:hypothetical protein
MTRDGRRTTRENQSSGTETKGKNPRPPKTNNAPRGKGENQRSSEPDKIDTRRNQSQEKHKGTQIKHRRHKSKHHNSTANQDTGQNTRTNKYADFGKIS